MRYYSTKNKSKLFSFRDAVLKGLPKDNGLFMPESIEKLPASVLSAFNEKNIPVIGFEVSKQFLNNEIPLTSLEQICSDAFNFPVPLVSLDESTFIAELFHGPTLAFKDFGARFMARVMSFLNRDEKKLLTILVATSGDTGNVAVPTAANGIANRGK